MHCNQNSKHDKKYSACSSDIESETLNDYFGCNEIPKTLVCREQPKCHKQKDPCPLKSFCDPGLMNTCNRTPCVDLSQPKRAITTWKVNYLVSNTPGEASHLDPDLIQPRGIVIYNNQLWVTNTMSDKITNYDLFGNKILGSIQVRWNRPVSSFPVGLAMNCSSGFSFTGSNGIQSRSATLMTATKTGDVAAYNPAVDSLRSYIVLNNKLAGEIAEYTGLAIVNNALYLADFYQGHVDAFDSQYLRIGVRNRRFIDNYSIDPIPITFGPHNIVYIEPYLYVMYAERDQNTIVHHVVGPGRGYISVFTLDGAFVRRFYSRGVLNTPWSIIPAPNECGIPPGSFLVNNIGDGRINIFDNCGNFIGPMLSQAGIPIVIDGLESLAPYYTTFNEIFFSSSADIETRGLLGSIVKDQVIYI